MSEIKFIIIIINFYYIIIIIIIISETRRELKIAHIERCTQPARQIGQS